MKPTFRFALASSALLALSRPALAVDVTLTATGHLDRTQSHRHSDGTYEPDRLGTVLGIHAGDTFTTTIVYDPTTPPGSFSGSTGFNSNAIWSSYRSYAFYPAVKSHTITVHAASGDYLFGLPNSSTVAPMINVQNGMVGLGDQISAGTSGGFSPTTPLPPTFPSDTRLRWGLHFDLSDSVGAAIDNGALPLSYNLGLFTGKTVSFYSYYDSPGGFNDGGDNTDYGLFGTIESLSTQIAPPDFTPTLPIRPLVQCVIDNRNGTFTAAFGYQNDNPTAVVVPSGHQNGFWPNPNSYFDFQDLGQPTTFQPGASPSYPNSFLVTWDGHVGQYPYVPGSEPRLWYINGWSALASKNSPACTNRPLGVVCDQNSHCASGNCSANACAAAVVPPVPASGPLSTFLTTLALLAGAAFLLSRQTVRSDGC